MILMPGTGDPRCPALVTTRRSRVHVCIAVLLCVLGWPLCGSQDSEGSQREWGEMGARGLREKGSAPTVAAMVAQLRHTALAGSLGSAPIQSTTSSREHIDTNAEASSQTIRASRKHAGRRGLQSGALRMLHDLAGLVLPRSEATLHRVFADIHTQQRDGEQSTGVWAETYVCLLHVVQQGLSAERSRQEEIELKEDGAVKSEMSKCRSDLAQIQQSLIDAAQENGAIGHSLRVWQRIGQGLGEHSQGASAETSHEGEAKAAANIKRLKAERLRSDLDARGLQAQEKLARIRCGLMEWQENHKYGDLPPRRSRLLAQAEQQIDDLGLDAPTLLNISRSTALNVTLPACSSRWQKRSSLLSRWLSLVGTGAGGRNNQRTWLHTAGVGDSKPANAFDILSMLQRSFQQASQNIFFDLTELKLSCDELQNKTRSDTDAMLHEGLDVVKMQGDVLHLERTVATMQTEFVALKTAQRETLEQAGRLEAAIGDDDLGLQQRELCSAALVRLQHREHSVKNKAQAKIKEMASPKLELSRLRQLLGDSQELEMTAQGEMTRDVLRQNRCLVGARSLRRSAGLIARHSAVLAHLANDYRLESHLSP